MLCHTFSDATEDEHAAVGVVKADLQDRSLQQASAKLKRPITCHSKCAQSARNASSDFPPMRCARVTIAIIYYHLKTLSGPMAIISAVKVRKCKLSRCNWRGEPRNAFIRTTGGTTGMTVVCQS